jgi:hypothetical protein
MGWLLFLMGHLTVWLDGLSERSILAAVPDLENLLLHPSRLRAGREVVIGPARRYGSVLVLSLFTAFITWFLTVFIAVLFGPRPWGRHMGWFLLGSFLLLQVTLFLLIARILRGGQMVWSGRGIELRYRSQVVFCPWSVFHTPGQPFSPGRGQVVLPVLPAAVPLVEARRHGQLMAEGIRVVTPQLWFRSPREMTLRAFYEVNTLELGKVLLHLGRLLGTAGIAPASSLDFPPEEPVAEEPVHAGADGWITVNLTRLVFPAECCDCGAATTGRQKFTVRERFFGPGRFLNPAGGDPAHIWVPVCYACQTANQGRFVRAVCNGLGIGLAAVLLAAAAARIFPNNLAVAYLVILTIIWAPLIGCLVGYQFGKARSQPLQLRNYSPARGTVSLKFRRTEYADHVVTASLGA